MTCKPESDRPGILLTVFGSLARLLGIETMTLSRPLQALILCSFLMLAMTAVFSLADTLDYAGVDFRNRIVGARVLLLGEDPYTFHWEPGMPDSLLDPGYDWLFPIHRLTVPPTVLYIYLPFVQLPYAVLRVLFGILEWAAMGCSVMLLTRSLPGQRWRVSFFLLASYLLVTQHFWRQHVERGQVYVFHLALLSAGVTLCLRQRRDSWGPGVAFGLAAAMRPNFLLLAPAFLALGKPRTAGATVLTFTVSVLATLPLAPPRMWKHYLETADLYYLATWDPDRLPPFTAPSKDRVIEGYHFFRELRDVQPTSFAAVLQRLHLITGRSFVNVGLLCKAILAGLAFWLLTLLFRHPRHYSLRLALGLMMVFLIDTEYFLPNRWTYVDVMFLLPLALLLPVLRMSLRTSLAPTGLLIAGVLLSSGPWSWEVPFLSRPGMADFGYLLAVLRSILVMGTFTGLALDAWGRQVHRRQKVTQTNLGEGKA